MKNFDTANPDWKAAIPRPIFDEEPGYLELYDLAWSLAREHVWDIPGMPQTPYMDEACVDTDIWIWDTCFMAFFCKYAPDVFPGIESLNNFYKVLHEGARLPEIVHRFGKLDIELGDKVQLCLHIPDNPPLFAWAEYCYVMMTGDLDHIESLLLEKKYLQKHFAFLENLKETGWKTDFTRAPTYWVKHEDGYSWEGGRSGMDNTPRGRKGTHAVVSRPVNPQMLWVDAIAQQGLSALYISKLAKLIGHDGLASEFHAEYQRIRQKVDSLYWDEEDGIFYDVNMETLEPMKTLTPAAFWPALAEIPSSTQFERMCAILKSPDKLGGVVPWVSLSRDDADFDADFGSYWRGSMWVPTAYMGVKSLEKYGRYDLAESTSRDILNHMCNTYKNFEPHTIWECYSPTSPTPAKVDSKSDWVRPDFCGWSALAPISLLIENVIGLNQANAVINSLQWHLPRKIVGRIGVENYRFGSIRASLLYDNNAGEVKVESNAGFKLIVDDKEYAITAGKQAFKV